MIAREGCDLGGSLERVGVLLCLPVSCAGDAGWNRNSGTRHFWNRACFCQKRRLAAKAVDRDPRCRPKLPAATSVLSSRRDSGFGFSPTDHLAADIPLLMLIPISRADHEICGSACSGRSGRLRRATATLGEPVGRGLFPGILNGWRTQHRLCRSFPWPWP